LKVITLDEDRLRLEVADFAIEYIKAMKIKSLYVVGVASAGIPIAKLFCDAVESSVNVSVGSVQCQRPSTQLKKEAGMKSKLMLLAFRLAPYYVLDNLRKIEHFVLSRRKGVSSTREVTGASVDWTACIAADRVLVIDDAIDSGVSMKTVLEYLTKRIAVDTLDSFAVVATQAEPVIEADYTLYENILIRFPWSLDYHKK